jgi:hypothetical protein
MSPLSLIAAQFPGKTHIPMVDAGAAIGYEKQTCYNLFHHGKFPLPVKKVGRKSMVALLDLARFMQGESVEKPTAPTRKPGRPTKKEQIERRNRLS